MNSRDRQRRRRRRNHPEASYDEASRAQYRVRSSRPGGSGSGGAGGGITLTRRLFTGLLGVVAARLAWLQLIQAPALAAEAESQRTNVATLHARRGTIYDRNGNVLALSVECQTIYANPEAVTDPSGVSDLLVEALGGKKSDYMDLLTQDTTFAYVRQRVDQEVAEELRAKLAEKELTGIYFLEDTKRTYPYGTVGSQLLGYVGTDGVGLSGLELYYDDVLTGTDGEMLMETGLYGTPVAGGAAEVTPAQDGVDLVLALDIDLQEACEQIIAEAVETYSAGSGSVMITNPRTGEILAACSTPLADFSNISSSGEELSLKPVTSSYEPGSVFKVITTAIGIEGGYFGPDRAYYVPARLLVGDNYVSDSDGRDYDMSMTVTDMMVRSSNAGLALLVQDAIGAEAFSEGVARWGIGSTTGIDFPGESAGIVRSLEQYDGSTAGSMAFGQGLSIPAVQVVRAFGAVANDGVPTTPHFVTHKGDEELSWPEGDQIVSAATADAETEMMRAVMQEGSGTAGQVDGYDFAGKTGTGEQASESGGYQANCYVASLCGFANADDPEVLVYVALNETPYLSSVSTSKPFHDIAEKAVTILGVTPVSSSDSTTSS